MSLVSDRMIPRVAVFCTDAAALSRARHWSQFLQAPLNPQSEEDFSFRLQVSNEDFFLVDIENRILEIDFDKNHLDYQRRGLRGKNELLAKALGAAKCYKRVLDLSVGLAVDSVLLTQLGFQVTGIERSPVLYALLSEAFRRACDPALQSYELIFADSLNYLRENKAHMKFDSIYFDPMYPHKKKTALPKQEMVVFRELVGHDTDAAEVLQEALTCPVHRVVVKRPLQAEELLPGVSHSYKGKVVRYDTYVVG